MNDVSREPVSISPWPLMLIAAAILMITMGAREQPRAIRVPPLNTATGLGIVAISFVLAVGQFTWGAAQPIFGALADRYGPEEVSCSAACCSL